MHKFRLHVFIIALYTVLTLISTYPQIRHMKQGIYSLSDQLFYAWVIERNIESLQAKPLEDFFNATIFYPYENTLSFGDHLLGETLFGWPFYAVTGNPVFAQNALILLSFILSAYGMFLYVDYLAKNKWAAFLSGVLFAFSHVRFNQYDHLNILSTEFLPFIFLYLHKFLSDGKRKDLVLLVVFFMICSLFSVYYLFMASLAIVIYVVVWLIVTKTGILRARNKLIRLAVGFIVGSAVILSVFLPYISFSREFPDAKRDIYDNIFYSASLTSFLSTAPVTLSARISGPIPSESDGGLFPGYILLALVAISMFSLRKQKTLLKTFFILLSVVFFVLSLGPFLKVTPEYRTSLPLPYYYLYNLLPPLQVMRVPARFAIFMQIFLSIAACYGMLSFFERRRHFYKKLFIACGITLLVVLETLSIPMPLTLVETKQDFPVVYHWLRTMPDDTVILELPVPLQPAVEERSEVVLRHAFMEDLSVLDRDNIEAYRNYFSLLHNKRSINGYSAFTPPLYNEIVTATQQFPDSRSLEKIRSSNIDFVILHTKQFPKEQVRPLILQLYLHPEIEVVNRFGDEYVVKIL